MRPISLHIMLLISAFTAMLFSNCAGKQISIRTQSLTNDQHIKGSLQREKRQLEDFDDEYPTAANQDSQEEPGFWDRVVKVALKLFSKFVEWLNS